MSEQWGSWTEGKQAVLRMAIEPRPNSDLIFSFTAQPFLFGELREQEVLVSVNGSLAGRVKFEGPGQRSFVIPVSRASVGSSGRLEIAFNIHDPRSPKDLGLNEDA
ncbi:hypothetical protein, partial [Moraxella catarrhalis]|uniref:hypothetical protein n=1 Tax=Moraxella catarrhalis TaxID=480 RepID=UPI0013D7717B